MFNWSQFQWYDWVLFVYLMLALSDVARTGQSISGKLSQIYELIYRMRSDGRQNGDDQRH